MNLCLVVVLYFLKQLKSSVNCSFVYIFYFFSIDVLKYFQLNVKLLYIDILIKCQ